MNARAIEVVKECKRQEESCLYTSTALFSWQKEVHRWRIAFIVIPIIAGAVATTKILLKDASYDYITAFAAMAAGLFPAIFKSLDLDVSVKTISDNASRFKVLQDRFRQASRIGAAGPEEKLDEDFQALMTRMDDARTACPAIPERHFKNAQKKIKSGDYNFDSTPNDDIK
jgi:hypothetical protein